jgi:hypothetical protein
VYLRMCCPMGKAISLYKTLDGSVFRVESRGFREWDIRESYSSRSETGVKKWSDHTCYVSMMV